MHGLLLDRRHALRLAVAAGAFPFARPAAADDAVVVVELFTSQGCSSCPQADAYLAELAQRPDVVALSYHVDYWDYLGWRDTLASQANGRRQKAYADRLDGGQVYTPQVVVQGAAAAVGSNRTDVEILIARARGALSPVSLAVEGPALRLSNAPEKARVWVAMVDPVVPVTIERGENAGRKVAYHNVVRALADAGPPDAGAVVVPVPAAPGLRRLAIVQGEGTGPILGTLWLDELQRS
ncbi:MAG: DUF1223 domain-containing protein [Hyphomicrobiales bacterium]